MTDKSRVIVFRDHLLAATEPFIYAQAEALERFEPCYAGSRIMPGLPPPPERDIITVNEGGVSGALWELFFKLFGTTPGFERRLRGLNAVLMHAHSGPTGHRVAGLAARLKIPLVVTFHGTDATERDVGQPLILSHRQFLRRPQRLFGSGSLFLAVSKFIRTKLLELGCPPEKIAVHYLGVDTARFSPAPLGGRENVVLFVGRLIESKGGDFLIKAFSQARLGGARLVVIGDGPRRYSLRARARAAGLDCEFLGVRTPGEVADWMRRARVLCVPSTELYTGECEALGMVFLEAQSCGLPVVSFSIGGVPEAVVHGETGLLAPDRDTRALADCLEELMNDDQRWKAFSEAAAKRVRAEFDLKTQTAKLELLYEKVLAAV